MNDITECQAELDRYAAYIGIKEIVGALADGKPGSGKRAEYAAAIPDAEWEEGRQIRRTMTINHLLADLRRRAVSRKTGKDDTKLGYLLREDYRGYHERWPSSGIVRGDGSIDSSQIRMVMANSIKGRGYTRVQFIAIMSFFYGHECYQKWKNKERVQEELATLWFKARGKRADEYKPVEVQPAPRGRAREHSELVEEAYQALVGFKAGTEAILTTQDLADALGIVRRTACTLLYELTKAGRIVYRSARWNSGIIVGFPQEGAIIGENENSDTPQSIAVNGHKPAEQITATKSEGAIIEENSKSVLQHKHADNDTSDGSKITATSGPHIYIYNTSTNSVSLALPTITPPLAELAANYLDQPAADIGERIVNTQTGAITYRRTAQHFAALVVAEYPDYAASEAREAYRAEQDRRDLLEKQEWQRFFLQLKRMTNDELIAYVQGGCKREVAELARADKSFDRHLYKTRLECAKRHIEWRGLTLPSRGQKPVTPHRQKRVERPAAEQQGMLNLVECERRDTGGLVERLQAAKARRQNE